MFARFQITSGVAFRSTLSSTLDCSRVNIGMILWSSQESFNIRRHTAIFLRLERMEK